MIKSNLHDFSYRCLFMSLICIHKVLCHSRLVCNNYRRNKKRSCPLLAWWEDRRWLLRRNQPSYIYPAALKDVVRARFPEELDTVPKPDPEGDTVRYIYNHVLRVSNTRTCTDVYKVYLYKNYLLPAGVHSNLPGPIPGQMACYKKCTSLQAGD